MEKDFIVRPAATSDGHEILAMHKELAEYCYFDMGKFGITEKQVRSIIDVSDQSKYFVAVARNTEAFSDKPRGMMLCHRIPLGWMGGSGVYIEDLYVQEPYRYGLGIGRLLLEQACSLALEYADGDPERSFLRLDTDMEHNDNTVRFYQRIGMSAEQLNFRISGQELASIAMGLGQ